MWLLFFSLEKPAAAPFNTRIALSWKSCKHHNKQMFLNYSEVVNYFFETYSKDEVIVENGSKIPLLAHMSDLTLTEYTEALWNNTVCSNLVEDEYILIWIFLERIHGTIHIASACTRAPVRTLLFTIWRVMQLCWQTCSHDCRFAASLYTTCRPRSNFEKKHLNRVAKVKNIHPHQGQIHMTFPHKVVVDHLLQSTALQLPSLNASHIFQQRVDAKGLLYRRLAQDLTAISQYISSQYHMSKAVITQNAHHAKVATSP